VNLASDRLGWRDFSPDGMRCRTEMGIMHNPRNHLGLIAYAQFVCGGLALTVTQTFTLEGTCADSVSTTSMSSPWAPRC
jgi:hypothetical protein